MKLAFISDLHLSLKTKDSNQLFFNLLKKFQNEVDALYILGDFFDYWLGDDDSNDFIESIKQALAAFTKFKPIYFIVGNHDFAVGTRFAKETGITLLKDCSVITVDNKKILLAHGDIFCTLDKNYQKMKKILTNPLTLFILRRTSLKFRYKLKEKLEHNAAKSFNTKAHETYHIVDKTIIKYAKKYKVNTVIHGHTHNPGIYKIHSKYGIIERIEIPDWSDHIAGGYIIVENKEIKINIPK